MTTQEAKTAIQNLEAKFESLQRQKAKLSEQVEARRREAAAMLVSGRSWEKVQEKISAGTSELGTLEIAIALVEEKLAEARQAHAEAEVREKRARREQVILEFKAEVPKIEAAFNEFAKASFRAMQLEEESWRLDISPMLFGRASVLLGYDGRMPLRQILNGLQELIESSKEKNG
jgi:DNA repair exonuclease SbcCD ATPase subunit